MLGPNIVIIQTNWCFRRSSSKSWWRLRGDETVLCLVSEHWTLLAVLSASYAVCMQVSKNTQVHVHYHRWVVGNGWLQSIADDRHRLRGRSAVHDQLSSLLSSALGVVGRQARRLTRAVDIQAGQAPLYAAFLTLFFHSTKLYISQTVRNLSVLQCGAVRLTSSTYNSLNTSMPVQSSDDVTELFTCSAAERLFAFILSDSSFHYRHMQCCSTYQLILVANWWNIVLLR